MAIRIGILGYGNLGKGVECAIKQNPDMKLAAVFTRRDPETVSILTEGVKVYRVEEAAQKKDEIDVMILCGGSATDLPEQTPKYAALYNVVDSFDTHARIPEHFDDVDAAAKRGGKVGIISCGWDPGMFSLAKRVWPEAEIHISTQANNTNYMTYRFWWELGAKRVVSARELTLAELSEIRANIPEEMEIESFVHGAMCISYSGRCLLSNYFTGRDANQGACTHPCRWKYAVVEESRPGEYLPVYENERGTYIFNSGDLCMIGHIPELIEAGIDSFKVEGRMKTALYVATVARTYRKAIDDYLAGEELRGDATGWTLVTAGGLSLGWAKGSGGVLKNHYPKGLRRRNS